MTDIWTELAAPFEPHEIEWRETGGRDAPYPRPDAIMNRLDKVLGPEGWDYTIAVVTADPRPVYICTLRVRDVAASVQPQPWVTRCATSGEPIMGRRDGPDFLNAGKAGGTYAFRKAFQDGFCRYLSDPARWPQRGGAAPAEPGFDEVYEPAHTGRAPHVPATAPAPATAGLPPTDFKGFTPSNPDNPPCPVCKGRMWDNREKERGGKSEHPKKNAKAPDFKCQNKACEGAWWPARERHTPKRPAGVPEDAQPVQDGEVPW